MQKYTRSRQDLENSNKQSAAKERECNETVCSFLSIILLWIRHFSTHKSSRRWQFDNDDNPLEFKRLFEMLNETRIKSEHPTEGSIFISVQIVAFRSLDRNLLNADCRPQQRAVDRSDWCESATQRK